MAADLSPPSAMALRSANATAAATLAAQHMELLRSRGRCSAATADSGGDEGGAGGERSRDSEADEEFLGARGGGPCIGWL